MMLAVVTETKPMTKPTDRSIPPLIITKVSPVARRSVVVEAIRILLILRRLKKLVPTRLKIPKSTSKKNNAQFLAISEKTIFRVFISATETNRDHL